MRVVTRAELIELPKGTVYSQWEPCVSRELFVHAGKLGCANDWYQFSCLPSPDDDFDQPVLSNSICREGTFNEEDKFAVYEEEDLRLLADALGMKLLPPGERSEML